MMSFLKLMLFLALAGCVALSCYMLYRYFNNKIISSHTLLRVIWFALAMIIANAVVLLVGAWSLLKLYEQLL